MQKKKLILIDGNALLYRSFYALPSLETTKGIPTGGVYGFTRILMKLLREEKPDYIACAFDKGRKTFRHQKWEQYKANRPETPPQLSQQGPLVKKILEGLSIPFFEEENYEADDIIASLAKKAEQVGVEVNIFTGDKDIFQIVSPSINIVRFKKGISKTEVYNPQKVKQEYGVSPKQMADYLCLVGDVSDNIPGVTGIGPKTAASLIQKYGDIQTILDNLNHVSPKLAHKIGENIQQINMSKNLSTVVTNISLGFDLEDLTTKPIKKSDILPVFRELEFKNMVKELEKENCSRVKQENRKKEEIPPLTDKLPENLDVPVIFQLEKKNSQWEIALSPINQSTIYKIELGKEPDKHPLVDPLKKILASREIKKIGHNLKETILNLNHWGIQLKGIEFDVSIAAYLLNSSCNSYSLSQIWINFLGEGEQEPCSLSSQVQLIKKLYPALKRGIEECNMGNLFREVEMPLVEILAQMQQKGIKIQVEILHDFAHRIAKKRKQIAEEIYHSLGERFNLNSPQQLAKVLFEKLNLPVIKKTKTGYSTSEEVLRALSAINPEVTKILEYRHLYKLESSYINPISELAASSGGRIHTSFSQITASTGRLSSFNPNLQNIPIREEVGKQIRKCFVAGEGHLFISADYSQIELRILAHLSGDKKLISAFLKGDDIHRETAAEIFNVLPLQVTSQMRRQAKAVNFGIIYGISPFGLARDLGIPEKEAKEYIKVYFNRYPEVKNFIQRTIKKVQEKGFVTTMMGRRRYIPVINSRNIRKRKLGERMAINSRIQGSAADLIKLAMVRVHRRLKQKNIPAWMILQIHDELLLETAKNKLEQVRKMVKEEMEQVVKLSVPVVVDTEIGENWAQMSH